MQLKAILLAIAMSTAGGLSAFADAALVMVEEKGCMWCERWNDDISAIYPKTSEGKIAPLMRIDMHASQPKGLTFKRPLAFTPTFVLMVDGVEVSRIEGYPGEDFFWGLLEQMMDQAGLTQALKS